MSPSGTPLIYDSFIKPWFAPPSWVFGPVWSVLYVLIAISFGYALYAVITKRWPTSAIVPFVINLIANLAYTPIQFALRNNVLALLDILIVLGTIAWIMRVTWQLDRRVTWAQVPYLLWVSFATVLQASITWLNT